jgi:dolichol-phosphate mannosyltransferase
MALVSIVVPVYCNAASLPLLHEHFTQIAASKREHQFEFIFVDDGSFDTSFAVLEQIAARDERVRIIKLSRNFGSNVALTAGLTYARGACAIMIAADLQDPPELIAPMIDHWATGTPVVLAARRTRGDPLMTRITATIFNRAFRKIVFPSFPPNGYDFALIDRRVVNVVVRSAEKNSYVFGLIMWSGFRQAVIEYDRNERIHGTSMWTFWKKVKYFIDAFTSFSYLPLRAASSIGLLMAGCGILYALIVLLARIFGGIPVEGWSSLMVVLLLTAGTQLIILGLIGEYIWRALEQTRSRPLFVVESVIGAPEPAAPTRNGYTHGSAHGADTPHYDNAIAGARDLGRRSDL